TDQSVMERAEALALFPGAAAGEVLGKGVGGTAHPDTRRTRGFFASHASIRHLAEQNRWFFHGWRMRLPHWAQGIACVRRGVRAAFIATILTHCNGPVKPHWPPQA